MELRQLRYFVGVAEELHFGKAAERLYISTPTLSQQIKQLEREIGTALLIRHSRGVELTPAGQVLLARARETLQAAGLALKDTRRAAGLDEPVLRLGLLNGIPGHLPAALEQLATERFPNSTVTLVAGTTTDQLRMLDAGEIDLGLVRTPLTLPPAITSEQLDDEELGVLLTATHPLAAQPELTLDDLTGLELIWIPRAAAPEFYDDTIRRIGTGVRLSDISMSHSQLRSALLVRRSAFSLGSRRAATPDIVWRPLTGRPLVAQYAAVWRTDSHNPVLQAMIVSPGLTVVRQQVVVD
ncbi:LysR family transcriptional regulator [Kribbella sp. VKM Ac-2566]|uniref:LysR family transcriptional regulator n=1 Tax=Kribbella sp. VKM Ac-2566 TaxID=2512218 RepID=UPI00106423C7|nr:LysR substrate-binding domain-containing protein [Kribbella sp. VKM Ac-2566]TDW88518.1 DNA-binding transcriptional LysR family regulator [Kribbella sp. VKM Ac-2566]